MESDDAPLLAFSTLGTPGWGAATVVQQAARMGFDGIEWRGGPDGTVRVDWSADRRARLRTLTESAGISAIAVTAYPELIVGDATVRSRSVDDLVAHGHLAADLGAPWVRAFVGVADDGAGAEELRRRAIDGLRAVLDRLAPIGVGLALEPHDAHVCAADVAPILAAIPDRSFGIVWDIGNGWAAGDDPAIGLAAYDGRIAWVQVKDGTGRGSAWRLGPIGTGEVPLREAIDGLRDRCGARGERVPPISIEWERAWYPELDPPETALPHGLAWLRDALDGPAGPSTAPTPPAASELAP